MRRFAVILTLVLFYPSALFAEPAPKPRGEPRNAWRYVLYNGRWWYWTPDDQWAVFNGQKWVTFSPESIGSSLADRTREAGEGRRGEDPRFSNSLEANTRSILDSTRPQLPLGASPTNAGGALGRGMGTIPSPAIRARSGDAGSGVGGGSVGGTSVTGSTAR
ncbi:MAG TPA: hypothetical protein VG826_34220 [Pirellulales bacterium]|nr:hypothetical protein [Pirellulales bacterium]